jgi:hypothetical protein
MEIPRFAAAAAIVVSLGCAPPPDPELVQAGSRLTMVHQAFSVMSSLFKPEYSPSATISTSSVAKSIEAALNGCGTVKLTQDAIEVRTNEGCEVAGVPFRGTLYVFVDASNGRWSISAYSAGDLLVDGKSLSSIDAVYDHEGSWVFSGNRDTATVRVVPEGDALRLTGKITTYVGVRGERKLDLLSRVGDCYPRGGDAEINAGGASMRFTEASATSGEVTVVDAQQTIPFRLPAYGRCQAR